MRIVGIIAEYNPFHQGHAYQIKKVRELTQADFILVSMSGNFVQRGAPAMFVGASCLHRHRKRRSLCQRRRQTAS